MVKQLSSFWAETWHEQLEQAPIGSHLVFHELHHPMEVEVEALQLVHAHPLAPIVILALA